MKIKKNWFSSGVLCLIAAIGAAAQTPVAAVKFDSETISGLGARNIGSAAMSGRIAVVDAVQEGQRLTVYVGSASGGVWKSVNGGTTFKPVFDKESVQSIGAVTIDPKNPKPCGSARARRGRAIPFPSATAFINQRTAATIGRISD